MLGLKIFKKQLDRKYYADCAIWCNKNNAKIVDNGDFYQIVKIEEKILTKQEKQIKEISELEKEIEKINISQIRDIAIILTSKDSEKVKEAEEYLKTKQIEKEKIVNSIKNLGRI